MNNIIQILLLHQNEFTPVVEFNPSKDKLLQMNFTQENKLLNPGTLAHINDFIAYINSQLQSAGARYGIGGYNENRTIYSSSKIFDGNKQGEEPRRLHLGIDIWGKPYTKIMAPLGGIIHSFAFNNHFGDYGATLILSHYLDGFTFYTLYGHLSLNSIKNIQEGDRVRKGDVIAEFGIPVENGHWPPHLHFQLIIDIGDYKGDYPGVCKFSEREKYLNNCPDPDLVVQMMQFA